MNYEESAAYFHEGMRKAMHILHLVYKLDWECIEYTQWMDILTSVRSLSSAEFEIEHIVLGFHILRQVRGLFEAGAWPNYFLNLILQLKTQTKNTWKCLCQFMYAWVHVTFKSGIVNKFNCKWHTVCCNELLLNNYQSWWKQMNILLANLENPQ